MIAVDTNLVVRVLTNDDPDQARRASTLMSGEPALIVRTVILEAEWVLRHAYGLERGVIVDAFKRLLGISTVQVEDPAVVSQALKWYEDGLDFADALHLAGARSMGASRFATFDKVFLRCSGRVSEIELIEP